MTVLSRIIRSASVVIITMVMLPTLAPAQQSLIQKVAGTWTLKDGREEFEDGHTKTPFITGQAMFDVNGHFFVFLVGKDRAKPSGGDLRAPVGPLVAFYGSYTANETDSTILYNIEYGSTPLLEGMKGRVWTITFNSGDVMRMAAKPLQTPEGPMTPVNEWTRAK
jgi:hypothetical protein